MINNNNSASGKYSGSVDRGGIAGAAGVTFANDQDAMNKCGRTQSSRDQWDVFRDRKLDEMKAHKLNVERRMQTAQNIDSQMYWSQRSDKLKRYPKHEALDPSWYTDNIYANSSIDLDDDEFNANTEKYDAFHPYYGINDYVHDLFERRKAYHKQHADSGDYNYPKSRSCCFGSGYDERPKPPLMPKSMSFSAATSTRVGTGAGAGANNTRHPYRIEEEDDFHDQRQNNNEFDPSGIRKFYCWEQCQQRRDRCDNERRKEIIYHIDGDPSNYKRHNDVDDMMNANRPTTTNCIRNIWQQNRAARATGPVPAAAATNFKVNNNELNRHEFDEPYDEHYDLYRKKMPPRNGHQHHSFDEEYLIVHQNKSPTDHYSHAIRRNYSDEMLSISRRQSQHSNVLDPIYDDECTKLLNNDDEYDPNANIFTLDDLNGCHRGVGVKSKSALEVKPPKRYDDSSSDSTDLDLDDFNFDFEKYWNELDKTTTSSSSGTIIAAAATGNVTTTTTNATIDRYDTEYRNNKCNFINANAKNINSANFKEKNINVDKYKKKCGQNIDVNLNDDDDDIDDTVDGIEDDNIDMIDDDDLMMDYRDHNHHQQQQQQRYKNNFLADGFMSPRRTAPSTLRSTRYPVNEMHRDNERIPISSRYDDTYHRTQQAHNTIDDSVNNNNNRINNNNIISEATRSSGSTVTGTGTGTGAISLINNIFSIYKPRKYSPVNCRAAATTVLSGGHHKSGTISKCMNVPSTVRPLGAPYNDFMTSMKRPLTITPTCYTSKRTWGGPSPTVDQPYFKIIPEKTGLKISPLYRFGFDDDDSKLRLKCTARPLLFPI